MKKLVLIAAIFTLTAACEKPEEFGSDETSKVLFEDTDIFLIDKDDIQEPDER